MKKQKFEGKIKNCDRNLCKFPCCDDGEVVEWINEYLAFHERIKDWLTEHGIKIKFCGDRVKFYNCSDGKNCKFIKYSLNKDIDPRPIDCKICPDIVDWNNIDFDKKQVNLYLWNKDCSVVLKGIPKNFKQTVRKILERDFAYLFYGLKFKINFIDEPMPHFKDRINYQDF
jgi:hypothetical protein